MTRPPHLPRDASAARSDNGTDKPAMAYRFRGFLPVVIDVETGGFNSATDALLELAAVTLDFDQRGNLQPDQTLHVHVAPEPGMNIEQAALDFTGIDPFSPLRGAIPEKEAMQQLFRLVRNAVKASGCNRAILVGHNAHFDQGFINAAANRQGIKRNPFHPFSCFDTVTLAGFAYGQTVLARACESAGLGFDSSEAHSALYDTRKTAELFCTIVNRWRDLGGFSELAESEQETY